MVEWRLNPNTEKFMPDTADETLRLNELEYLEMPGLNVMLAHDYYPESHQGGVGIIQNGLRVATNGDVRLDRAPGQWSPVPRVGPRVVDRTTGEISVTMSFPDEEKNRKGFNPIEYPDVELSYTIRVVPDGRAFRIVVDLETPVPAEWVGRVGFLLEFFPGYLFGKTFVMDTTTGLFPRQVNGPGRIDEFGEYQIEPMAVGRKLVIAPECEQHRMVIEDVAGGEIELLDGRSCHNNGWFIVRSVLPAGKTTSALEWRVAPNAIPGFICDPVVQVSQVGYHPAQQKFAVVELDRSDPRRLPVVLERVSETGARTTVMSETPADWGDFLRFRYLRLEFSAVDEPGTYIVSYGETQSDPFRIDRSVFARDVWQPTLEYFLPVQMCHMRINERSRVWHGDCHRDDARMAPVDFNHFDGYIQGPSTLCTFQPGEHVPGLNVGGWHDAGDHDLRIESQASTVYGLALAYEEFGVEYDNTTVDQKNRIVEIHLPDGKPDILQQIEHGVLSIVGAYNTLGRLYRGIICPTLRQYTILGDPVNQTDGVVFDPDAAAGDPPPVGLPGSPDDRWVFTEDNPRRELAAAAALATASRALREYNAELARDCLCVAEELHSVTTSEDPLDRVGLDVELLLATGEARYRDSLLAAREAIVEGFSRVGWVVGRVVATIGDDDFTNAITRAAREHRAEIDRLERKTPYGLPYEPNIWGAGWGIQSFGMRQYFLHSAFPELFPAKFMLHALNFVLGCHPGRNTSSFVSGVGSRSLTVAYGFNRADWSYIPGGSASGTALIRPDFPELLEWPFLWQQTEYVLGGGTTDFLILALAADRVLNGG
ncbi:MAG: glycoside hydrolase [Spirochaetaceae bacterium]|nr:MAG: glycoside hydrolase [Spirochaetaceae bacterium]